MTYLSVAVSSISCQEENFVALRTQASIFSSGRASKSFWFSILKRLPCKNFSKVRKRVYLRMNEVSNTSLKSMSSGIV